MTRVDIVLATRNGATTLPRTLEGLIALRSDSRIKYRVIVVDNGSSDETPSLLRSFQDRLPIVILGHPMPGKNSALNRALSMVDSELLVFIDDDVIVYPDWLNELILAADAHPDYSIFGGSIEPCWDSAPPTWILESVPPGPAFGCSSSRVAQEGPTSPYAIWGTNMMIRSHLFTVQGYRFDEEVGPRPGSYIMGSETDLTRRLSDNGEKCWYVASARVRHIVRSEQLTRPWLIGRAMKFGRSIARDDFLSGANRELPTLFGVPRWRFRAWIASEIAALMSRLMGSEKKDFSKTWNAAVCRGYLLQAAAYRRQQTD